MIKKSLLTILLTAMVGFITAQTLQIEHDGYVYGNDETIICVYNEAMFEYDHHMQIRNNSNEALNVVVEQDILETVTDAMVSFCWGLCIAPGGPNVSPEVTIPAQTLSGEDFAVHIYIPEQETGVVKIRYYVYDINNPDNKISILVLAGLTADVAEHTISLGQVYPNPATSQINFDYTNNDGSVINVLVYNLLGQEVKSQTTSNTQGRISIAVDDLQPGIYFCSFSVGNEVVRTEKFIVKR